MKYVIKRDGRKQKFNQSKIENAINKALIEIYNNLEGKENISKIITENIIKILSNDNIKEISIEQIQDLIEEQLMLIGEYKVAKAYILYRDKRTAIRESIKQVYYTSEYLDESFLKKYPDYPPQMSSISRFTFIRTYSRDIEELKRRETWKETCIRSINDNISLDTRERTNEVVKELKQEAEKLFDLQFNLRGFLSGRALFTGGTKASKKFPLSLFNCSGVEPNNLEAFKDTLYLLSVGAGVGYRATFDTVNQLPNIIQTKELILNNPLFLVPKNIRQEDTTIVEYDDEVMMTIGDSKEGWSNSIYYYLQFMTGEIYSNKQRMKIIFSHIRPEGTPLKTFGGYASGHKPLMKAFEKIHEVITTDYKDSEGNILTPKAENGKLRPIHIMHIMNCIAEAIVVGGVRRSATICLFDNTDEELKKCKKCFKNQDDPKISHYYLSNNTALYSHKPSKEEIEEVILTIKNYGEPGFANEQEILKRHPFARIINPCFEILLRPNQTCNLVTYNVDSYVIEKNDKKYFNWNKLKDDLQVLTRSAFRVTIRPLELPKWDEIQKKDRLLGVSPTSWMDMVEHLGINFEEEKIMLRKIKDIIRTTANNYADLLKLNHPLNTTCVKPSGTLGLLANAGSPGVHVSHSPYYIRRIRVSKSNPIYDVIKRLNWYIEDDVKQPEQTVVVSFPIKSPVNRTKYDISAIEQLERYKLFQENYTEQNTSITVTVKNDEWEEVANWIYNNWNSVTGISFLSLTDHKYNQAPYETIDEETYNKMIDGLDELTHDKIVKYMNLDSLYKPQDDAESCSSGACALDRLF